MTNIIDIEFEKFYLEGQYNNWDPTDEVISKKTIMYQMFNKGYQLAFQEGREQLATELCRSLHLHMGKKKVITYD